MAAINILNANFISRQSKPGKYADGGGLYLWVRNDQGKQWVYRYTSQYEIVRNKDGSPHARQARQRAKVAPLNEPGHLPCHQLGRRSQDGGPCQDTNSTGPRPDRRAPQNARGRKPGRRAEVETPTVEQAILNFFEPHQSVFG